ncbi:MAG: hypothetical protein ACKOAF_00650 [Actinomycetes bacterium]
MVAVIPGVPEFGVVDLFDPALDARERDDSFRDYSVIHAHYFPSYPHVLEDISIHLATEVPPDGEIVHAWLLSRDGKPVGIWNFNVNVRTGVVLMLFGAIHRHARIDLPREYLPRLIGYLLGICEAEAHGLGFSLHAAILESDVHHLRRWESCGFTVVDSEYREPIHGAHWPNFGDLAFFEDYSACVLPIDAGHAKSRADLAKMCLRALLIDHYRLPENHPNVEASLRRAEAIRS